MGAEDLCFNRRTGVVADSLCEGSYPLNLDHHSVCQTTQVTGTQATAFATSASTPVFLQLRVILFE